MPRPGRELALKPGAFYLAKGAMTRVRSVTWWLRSRDREPRPGVRILFYHRVADAPDVLAIAPRRFREHMELLAAKGLQVINVEEIAARLDRGDEALAGVVGLCFDDGYRDVAEHAVPVLARLGFRATVFVATGVVDGSARFAWYKQQPPVMSWDVIRDLDVEGVVSFGAHTVTHPNLLALDEALARTEIVGSKATLEARLGHATNAFCYPAGLFGARERRIVAGAGFQVATSCEPGANLPSTDRLALRRLQVDPGDSLIDLRAKLAGAHDESSRVRTAWRRRRYPGTAIPPRSMASR